MEIAAPDTTEGKGKERFAAERTCGQLGCDVRADRARARARAPVTCVVLNK